MNTKSFIRLGDKAKVDELVTEANRVGYTVEWSSYKMLVKVSDPTSNNAPVFKALTPANGVWAITFYNDYWKEPTP